MFLTADWETDGEELDETLLLTCGDGETIAGVEKWTGTETGTGVGTTGTGVGVGVGT